MPEKIINATTTRWVLTIGFSDNRKKNRFHRENRLSATDRQFPNAEEVRLAIRHFAQLTKRIAKCRKRNPASRILLRAICVAQITTRLLRKIGCFAAVCVGQSASRSVPQSNRSA